jgi:hypothetical protein
VLTRVRYGVLGLLLILSVLALPDRSQAIVMGACELDLPGQCSTSISLSGDKVTIALENTSTAPGYIVADAFNVGAATVNLGSFTSSDPDFKIAVLPFTSLDTLITINWFGGSTISDGIGAGQTAWFSFTLRNYAGVTEESILNSTLIGFIGYRSLDVDQVPVKRVAMPEFGSLPLLGLGLGGLGILWRRRQVQQ